MYKHNAADDAVVMASVSFAKLCHLIPRGTTRQSNMHEPRVANILKADARVFGKQCSIHESMTNKTRQAPCQKLATIIG